MKLFMNIKYRFKPSVTFSNLILFFIFGSSVFLVGCQRSATVSQVSYTDDSLGLSFQYPSELWEIIQEDDAQVFLSRQGKDGQEAIVVISVDSADQLDFDNPHEYLATKRNGRQTGCLEKQIIEKSHPRFDAMATCIDFVLDSENIPLGSFTIPSELTVLMTSSTIIQVLYAPNGVSAEVHQEEVEDIISSIVLQ